MARNMFGNADWVTQQAMSPVLTQAVQQPAKFANVFGQNYGNYAQGLAGLGNSYANAFGSYGGALASLANAQANERGNRYGANAMAEAARQGTVGNIGSAALGAYGSAANSALGAWANNQMAYNKAASDMHAANQTSMSQYGQSRNQALGQMSGAYGGIGKADAAAAALGGMNFGFGGGGGGGDTFSASGPSGSIASGSYSGGGGGGFSGSASLGRGPGGGGALGGLASLQNNLMSPDIPNRLDAGAEAGRRQLDMQHYTSRNMPSQMLDQALGGLAGLGAQAYGASGLGMNQFYGAQNEAARGSNYNQILGSLNRGYGGVGRQLGGVQRDLGGGYRTANDQVNNLWNNSLGNMDIFQSPLKAAQQERAADLYNRGNGLRDRVWDWENSAFPTMAEYYRKRLNTLPTA